MPSSPKFNISSQHSTKMRRSTIFVVSCLAVIGIYGLVFALTSYNILQPYVNLGLPCQNPNTTSPGLLTLTGPSSGSKPADAKHLRYGGGEGHKLIGFVGIQTGFGSVGRRKSLRKSWMPSNQADLRRLEESTGLALRFVIGRTSDEGKMSELKQEIATYNDFLQLDIEETYDNLPHKTIAYMRAAFALFDAKFYVKIDDDIYVRPDRLSVLLNQERSHPYTYIGCMTKGKFYNNPKHKWYEPLSYMLGGEYFMYAYGSIYALSADVVAIVASVKNESLRLFRNEDVTVGSWMLALNVSHEDNRALCQLECSPTSIAVWNEYKCTGVCDPEINLVKLHENEICSKDPSKLPEN